MSVTGRVRELIEPSLTTKGLEVVDVEQRANVLRISIDRPDGIDLDAISTATRLVSAELDRHDVVPGRYVLEVSSPGVERPLRTPQHFRRFVGSTLAVRTVAGTEGDRRIQGILDEADDDGLVVDDRRLSYAKVDRAHTVFVWGPSPRPGKSKANTRTKAKAKAKAKAVTP
ncbi:MAG: ribosome maturation factor RimP [Acidimicrobiales bacterium]